MKRKHISLLILSMGFLVCTCYTHAQGSPTDSILQHWLFPQTVNNNSPVFNTFYFWTSVAELDSVEQQKRLLRTSVSDQRMESMYTFCMVEIADDNEPIRNHLMSGQRQRIRAAWPCYWTQLSQTIEYSPNDDQLVQVVLMDSALIVAFEPDEKPKHRWKIFDLKGNVLTMEEAMERKRHIAAVFMTGKQTISFPGPSRIKFIDYFRSFILCNEDMIKSWHHAVPGLQAKILNDLDYLLLLRAWLEKPENCKEQGRKGKNCRAMWSGLTPQSNVADHLFATMSFAGEKENDAKLEYVTEVISRLRELWIVQKNPCERFPGKNPVYIPPRK